jgi:two-component system sensor histidine kinase KdpD
MERIINDYISSSMLENYEIPEKEQLDLRLDIIDPLLEEFAAAIEAKEITFDNSLGSIPSGEIITMNTNRTFLYIIYRNLFENSIRFTPHGGIIAIGYEKQDKFIKLNVWDNGPPVECGKEEEIFKLKYSQDSTGLGLYVCRDLAEKLGGNMWYENSPDGHPNFLFTIPI